MVQISSPTGLPGVLCDFVHLVLAGGIPHAVRHAFFGATLHALKKKEGGHGRLCLRRLASKLANCWATAELLSTLAPHQFGVEVCGGAEAIVHAAEAFVASASPFHALVKLDFSNTFNMVR